MAKVKVNGCAGCQACTGIAPNVFKMNDNYEAYCVYGDSDVPNDYMDDVRTASEICIAAAISIEE